MKRMTCLSLILAVMAVTAHAADIYKPIPFKLNMSKEDSVNVNYDFSEKKSIICTTNNKHVRIDFTYKGRKKFANLPIILQSDHVPSKKNEALADLSGRFVLSLSASQNKSYLVTCDYPAPSME